MSILVAHHPISFEEGVPKLLHFPWNWRVVITEMTWCWLYKVLVDAVRCSSKHPHISKEGYEPLKQQWMSLLATPHFISYAERVPPPPTWYFAYIKFEDCFYNIDMVWTIWGLHILPWALILILMHLRKVMSHLSSNGCLSLCHIFLFSLRRRYLKYNILHRIL